MKRAARITFLLLPVLFVAACTQRASDSGASATGTHDAESAIWFGGSYEDGLAQARASSKLMFIDFNTSWCPPCRKLEKETFSQPEVQTELARMVSMTIDAESPAGVPLARKYRISGYPEMIVLEPDGKELGRISGFQPPDEFLARIAKIRERASR